jgi:hypothetical protein
VAREEVLDKRRWKALEGVAEKKGSSERGSIAAVTDP